MKRLTIRSLLASLELPSDTLFTVEGNLLIVDAARTFLAHDYPAFLRHERLRIVDQGKIYEVLIQVFPAAGGGEVTFCEPISLTGTLSGSCGQFHIVPSFCHIISTCDPSLSVQIEF